MIHNLPPPAPGIGARTIAAPRRSACSRFLARLPLLAALVAGFVLTGCGSQPAREAPRAEAPSTSPAPRVSTPRGGGYYKDDGPDDMIPAGLDDIPDAEPRVEPLHRFANRPYHVMGQSFVPVTELRAFRQRGHASWYGRRFHGKPTSSGEPYDMYGMTAAHPTLPIPSYVRVTHLGNGRSVVVRVNDRGPFLRGRVIDLSYAAAHKLGYINTGSAEVEVEQILPGEAPMIATRPVPPLPARAGEGAVAAAAGEELPAARALAPLVRAEAQPAPGIASAAVGECADAAVCGAAAGLAPPIASASAGIFLQLGAFSSYANAEGFRDTVQSQASTLAERFELLADGERFRLHAGPYDSVDAARNAAERMGTMLKLKPFVVVR